MLTPSRRRRSSTTCCRESSSYGTGKAAQLPGRQVAGKTGTTENYGDAWFVGYTPQFVAAVWVGYPDKLVPMTTEFHGHPVAGGTFPALIWKAFMTKALDEAPPAAESFTPPDYGYASPVTVVNRGGVLERDDGVCHNTVQMQFFSGEGAVQGRDVQAERGRDPGRGRPVARRREVAAPGAAADAVGRLQAGRSEPRRSASSSAQFPAKGTASANDQITIVLPKSRTASSRTSSACRSTRRARSSSA